MNDEQPVVASATDAPTGSHEPNGRSVDAGRAVEWIKQGWAYFLMNPGVWIGITAVLLVVGVVLGIAPVVGQLALTLLTPVLGAGLLLGCQSLRDGGELRFDHLFAGFRQNTGGLIMVGVYYLIGVVVIMLATFLVGGGAAMTGAITGNGIGAGIALGGLLLALLIMLVLMVPLIMAIWFAPALVVFHGTEPVTAMKASFAASMKNVLPILVYSILMLVLGLVASLPIFLGWLVLVPVLIGAHYTSYLDIFE
jgi:uncharacterized membrane protein